MQKKMYSVKYLFYVAMPHFTRNLNIRSLKSCLKKTKKWGNGNSNYVWNEGTDIQITCKMRQRIFKLRFFNCTQQKQIKKKVLGKKINYNLCNLVIIIFSSSMTFFFKWMVNLIIKTIDSCLKINYTAYHIIV